MPWLRRTRTNGTASAARKHILTARSAIAENSAATIDPMLIELDVVQAKLGDIEGAVSSGRGVEPPEGLLQAARAFATDVAEQDPRTWTPTDQQRVAARLRQVSDLTNSSWILARRPRSASEVSYDLSNWQAITHGYESDAKRQRRMSVAILFLSITNFVGSVVTGALGVRYLTDQPQSSPASLVAFVALAVLMVIIGSVLTVPAERYRRSAAESQRLVRQVSSLEPFLAPFTPELHDLMRATLAPRLFAGSLDNDDPFSEPVWPRSKDLRSYRPVESASFWRRR